MSTSCEIQFAMKLFALNYKLKLNFA